MKTLDKLFEEVGKSWAGRFLRNFFTLMGVLLFFVLCACVFMGALAGVAYLADLWGVWVLGVVVFLIFVGIAISMTRSDY